MKIVSKMYEMDILRSMWLRSGGGHYPLDDTREFSIDGRADLDLLELPWYIANSIGNVQGGPRVLLREWRRIRKEGGVEFQTIMALVIDNIELVREPLEPEDIRAAIIDLRPQAKQRLLSGSILFVRNREEDLNVMLSRLNAIAGWVSLVDAAEFDDYIRKGYERGGTGTRSDVDRRLPSAYDVLLFRALNPMCDEYGVDAQKILSWRDVNDGGKTALVNLALHNVLVSNAKEKEGSEPIDDEFVDMINPMTVPLAYVLCAFSIGKDNDEMHSVSSGLEIIDWWQNCRRYNQRLYRRIVKGYFRSVRRVHLSSEPTVPVVPVYKVLEADLQWSMFLRSFGQSVYPDDISILTQRDVTLDPDSLEVPWYVYFGLRPNSQESSMEVLNRWRLIRIESGHEFHRVMSPVITYINMKRSQYALEDTRYPDEEEERLSDQGDVEYGDLVDSTIQDVSA